ncbi:hypothetical protein RDWZM_008214 [Blomia tropicalis]|uniref:Scavenger receptor class B member 1 n=1 Tax=Blomia tropicalis TaxID=40697 RepID=A0A9Q0M1C5_BLOTA|nr:hypothetical protein RDWZM_008214 [Blomia tropicalis]
MFAPVVNNILVTISQLYNENLIEVRSIEDVLTGREVGILKTLNTITTPMKQLGIAVPDINVGLYKLSETTFGFIKLRDNQTFGPTEMYTGRSSIGRFNYIRSINDKRQLPFFRSYCNQILGTDGTFFGAHPPMGPNVSIYIHNPHLCRPMKFDFDKESHVKMINTYRYLMDYRQFSILQDTRNWCYCPKGETINRCEGVLFMKQCLDGAPLALSNPHFLQSHRLLARVQGLHPDAKHHQGFLELERTLGSSAEVSIRVQLNLDLKPYSAVQRLNSFRPVIMPYLWFDEGALIEGYLHYLIMIASWTIELSQELFILLGTIGVFLIIKGIAKIIYKRIIKNKKIIPDHDESNSNGK